ncbi:MAG TPA: DnaJ C-terminal domain-containing protein [Vicinamibacterales bacterium]|nr:DnaJ C-terminal domain-containing protein [Vicinamibacterales bacterium]
MEFRDYYATLGVAKTATEAEIKKAYRKLARAHHPDLNPGDKKAEARFKEVNEAYEVLGDAEKRRKYDELGANWRAYEQAPPGAQPGWSPGGGGRTTYRTMTPEEMEELFGGQDPFSDFFHTFFSGGGGQRTQARARRTQRRPQPAEAPTLEMSLEEAFRGATRRLMIAEDGGERTLDVRIPAGVTDGASIRVPGKNGSGDLYLTVKILPHPAFERRGNDLYVRAAVPVTTAVLGGEVTVPTIGESSLRLKVPEGTRAGRLLRLRGHGMPIVGSDTRGDLYATVEVQVPSALTPEERRHYEALREIEEGRKS